MSTPNKVYIVKEAIYLTALQYFWYISKLFSELALDVCTLALIFLRVVIFFSAGWLRRCMKASRSLCSVRNKLFGGKKTGNRYCTIWYMAQNVTAASSRRFPDRNGAAFVGYFLLMRTQQNHLLNTRYVNDHNSMFNYSAKYIQHFNNLSFSKKKNTPKWQK